MVLMHLRIVYHMGLRSTRALGPFRKTLVSMKRLKFVVMAAAISEAGPVLRWGISDRGKLGL